MHRREVFLMDLMFHGRVPQQTKRQICSILISNKKELKVVALPVQQQSNAIDFGVFWSIYSLHFIRKENFDTSEMRTHFFQCLVKNELSLFRHGDRNHRKYIHKTIFTALFCSCSMSWAKFD